MRSNFIFLTTLVLQALAWNEYEFHVPNSNSIDGLQWHEVSGNWKKVPKDLFGANVAEGTTSPFKLGWRLKSEGDSSAIIYQYDSSIVPLLSELTDGGSGIEVFLIHTIDTTYHVDGFSNSAVAKRAIWDDGDFGPLPFQDRVLSITNVGCPLGVPLTLEIWDRNGVHQLLEGVDDISYTLPDAFPFNVTASAPKWDTFAELYITGDEPILYAVGGGTIPSVTASYDLKIQICPD